MRKYDALILTGLIFAFAQLFVIPISFVIPSVWWFIGLELVTLFLTTMLASLLMVNNPDFMKDDFDNDEDN